MNTIVVHSTQPWNPNARASVEAAAARWNCNIQVFTHDFFPHPSFARLDLKLGADRVLVLDPDIVVAAACPNPFDHTDPTFIYMTPEFQYENPNHLYPIKQCIQFWSEILGRPCQPKKHLNGGWCLYTPHLHEDGIHKVRDWWRAKGSPSMGPLYEQPMWYEVGEWEGWLPIKRVSKWLNRHTPHVGTVPWAFGNHMSGGNRKDERLIACNWREAPTEPERIWAAANLFCPTSAPLLREWSLISLFAEKTAVVGRKMGGVAYAVAAMTPGQVHWYADFGSRSQLGAVVQDVRPLGDRIVLVNRVPEKVEGQFVLYEDEVSRGGN